jgi:hypothetical protein
LSKAVKIFPTPRVSDTEGGIVKNVELKDGSFSRVNKDGVRWGVKLKDAVNHLEMFPTPTVPGKHQVGVMGEWGGTGNPYRTPENMSVKTGSLNPEWVCWLMGYPPNWVDIGTKNQISPESQQESKTESRNSVDSETP